MTARILVVDDVTANRRLLEAKLAAEYYEVALAASGPEALATVARWAPDVILLDVMMPEMDGFEVCRRLKAQPRTAHVPVVMVTALTDPTERVQGLEAGADDFLSKPVDDATLFSRLRALLRMKQVLDAWQLRAETARDLGLEPPPAPSGDIRGARVLVVDEHPAEAEALALILAGDGATVRHCTAAEAWEPLTTGAAAGWNGAAAAAAGWDLIALSLSLPGGDALRLASRLRAGAETRDLPVLLLADPDRRDLVLRGFDLGANDHVLRPVDPHELRARVRNQIRRRRYQERLRTDLDRSLELAVTDSLTGLRNRRYVRRHLEGLLRTDGAAVLLMDVDRFKALNDTHGHAAGDVALREVATRLRAHVRAADVVARYGGEEFLVAMAGATAEDAASVAERLRVAVAAAPVPVAAGTAVPVTISLGVALAPRGTGVEALVGAADAALYRAKRNGRDRVEVAAGEDWAMTVGDDAGASFGG